MPNHNEECERCYWRGRAEAAEAERDELREAMAMVGNAPSDLGRAVSAEAEVARLTRLLEQRTAALTRTIDAKNAAEAKVTRVEAARNTWVAELDSGAIRDNGARYCWGQAVREIDDALDGGQP